MIYDVSVMRSNGFDKNNIKDIIASVGSNLERIPVVNNDRSIWFKIRDVDINKNSDLLKLILKFSFNNVLILRIQDKETFSSCIELFYEDGELKAHRELEKNKDRNGFIYKPFYVKDMDIHKFEAGI